MDVPFETLINSEKPTLVDFYADWCGPCQMFGPILKEVKDALGDRVNVIKINVDGNTEVASHYGSRVFPR